MNEGQEQISLQINTPEFWDAAWREAREQYSSRRKRRSLEESINYWNKRAASFEKNVMGEKKQKRIKKVFNWLENQGVSLDNIKVLDIGAGPGAFALAFARRAKEVVALEPAAEMVAFLNERVAKNNIQNIKIIQNAWEEIDLEEHNLKQQFDLVFASMTPGINDGGMVEKALNCAQKYCYISDFAGKRENDALSALWQILFGENIRAWSGNIIHIFNYLYARGFDLSFDVWEEKVEMEHTGEEALFRLQEDLRNYGVDEHLRQDARVKRFVQDRLVDGKFRQRLVTRLGWILVRLK